MVAESSRNLKRNKMENGDGNKIFDRAFIKQMRTVSASGANPYSLKQMMLFVVARAATLERNLQKQINELKENGK
jgi:hypothetical protein